MKIKDKDCRILTVKYENADYLKIPSVDEDKKIRIHKKVHGELLKEDGTLISMNVSISVTNYLTGHRFEIFGVKIVEIEGVVDTKILNSISPQIALEATQFVVDFSNKLIDDLQANIPHMSIDEDVFNNEPINKVN